MPDGPALLTVADAARLVGVDERTVRSWTRRGHLAEQPGGRAVTGRRLAMPQGPPAPV